MLFSEILRLAGASLNANKLRSSLTVLGIAARNLDGGYQTWVAARRAGLVVT